MSINGMCGLSISPWVREYPGAVYFVPPTTNSAQKAT